MSDIKQTFTRTKEQGVDETGVPIQQETRQVHTEAATDKKTTAQNIVWFILGVIEVLLGIRFVLKLLGANYLSSFVHFVYAISSILTLPFDSIFGVSSATAVSTRSVFEPSIIVAGLVYALVAWGIVKLIYINQKR